jgi:hypothetical protein
MSCYTQIDIKSMASDKWLKNFFLSVPGTGIGKSKDQGLADMVLVSDEGTLLCPQFCSGLSWWKGQESSPRLVFFYIREKNLIKPS